MLENFRRLVAKIFKKDGASIVALYNMLFTRSPLPQAITNDAGIFVDVNEAFCNLHDVNRQDLIGKTFVQLGFCTPVELQQMLELFVSSGDRLEGLETKYTIQGSVILYVRLFAHRIIHERHSRILVVLNDISQERIADSAFKESDRFFHTVLNSIPTRVFWKDRNSVIKGCNVNAAIDAGFSSPNELIGKTDYDLYKKEMADQFVTDDQYVMHHQSAKLFFEEIGTDSMGISHCKLTSKVPLKDSTGNVIGILGTYDNITQRKQVEVALRLARFSIDHATSSILWISKSGQIVDFNPAFCRMLQYSRDELLKLGIPDIDPLYTADAWPSHWEDLRRNEVLTFLTKQRRKDGRVLDIEVRAHFLEFDGQQYNCAFINDVSERKESEERLFLSHNFLQAVLNNIPSGVFWKDRQFKYLGGNSLFKKISNFQSDADLLGKTDYDFPWVENVLALREDDRYVMENNTAKLYYIEPLRNADGKIHYNEVSKVPLVNDSGEVIGLLGTFRDITEQLEAENALKESEKLFKSVVQNASAIIYIIDTKGVFRLSEGLGLAALHLKPGEVIGKSVFEMYNDFPEITSAVTRALQGEVVANEIAINGITFSNRYTPMRNDRNDITSILCVSFDITSRKRLEEELGKLNTELEQHINELKESEFKFRQIIHSNPMGIYVYEVSPPNKLVLVDTNPAADLLTGLENRKFIGLTIEESFPDIEQTDLPSLYLDTALSGTPCYVEDFHFNRGIVKGVFQIYGFQAGRNRVAVMFLNITERKQIEAAIRLKNEELLKANAELDRFVYSASHDLRAPIASLLGLIQVARAERDLDGIGILLDMQERSLRKLDEFIQDIVSYSRNNRVNVEQVPIDFSLIITGVFGQLQFMDQSRAIERRIIVPPDLNFSGDQKRVTVVLNNLISNAFKYAQIDKEKPFVEVRVDRGENSIHISVIDNGEGIAPEYLPKIFEMFFRASQKSSGSGIGLYIVKEIVHKMGGTIEVTSSIGEGSTFVITLPYLNSLK